MLRRHYRRKSTSTVILITETFGGSFLDEKPGACGSKQQKAKPEVHRPLSSCAIVVSKPRAITCKVMIPASRLPRSMSEMCPLFMSR